MKPSTTKLLSLKTYTQSIRFNKKHGGEVVNEEDDDGGDVDGADGMGRMISTH